MKEQKAKYVFSVKDAINYGVGEAIMLQNIRFWVSTNKKRQSPMHLKNDRYWTFNSVRAFAGLFPFWTEKQVERILKSLIRQEAILKGRFNRIAYDKTTWYTVNDDSSLVAFDEKSLPPNGEMEDTELSDSIHQAVEPIPDINDKYNNQDLTVSTTRHESKVDSFFSKEEKPREEKNSSESLVLALDQNELESLAQLKYLDDHDQSFLADIVDRPLVDMTKKQNAKLDKIRKKAMNGKKLQKLRPKDPDDIEFEQKQSLKVRKRILEVEAISDSNLMHTNWARREYGLEPEMNESPEHFRERILVEIELHKDLW